MKTKEVQLLAILAIIAGSIIALSMWGGQSHNPQDTTAQETSSPDRAADRIGSSVAGAQYDEIKAFPSSSLDDINRFLAQLPLKNPDEPSDKIRRADDPDTRASLSDELLLERLRGSFSPLETAPEDSLEERLAETRPEEIPLVKSPEATEEKSETAAASKPVEVYIVKRGDTLGHISQRFYGTSTRWRVILDANKDILSSPERLRPDMQLRIPASEEIRVSGAAAAESQGAVKLSATSDKGRTYTVRKGDTLWDIAVRHYDDGTRHRQIFENNRDVITDPNRLVAGSVIIIP